MKVKTTETVEGYDNWKQAVKDSPLARDALRIEFVHRIDGSVYARMIQSGQFRNSIPIDLGGFTQTGHIDAGISPNSGWYYC